MNCLTTSHAQASASLLLTTAGTLSSPCAFPTTSGCSRERRILLLWWTGVNPSVPLGRQLLQILILTTPHIDRATHFLTTA
jgi:hypothetical protein